MPNEATAEDRQRGALLIAASLIAAIRLRGEPINHPRDGAYQGQREIFA